MDQHSPQEPQQQQQVNPYQYDLDNPYHTGQAQPTHETQPTQQAYGSQPTQQAYGPQRKQQAYGSQPTQQAYPASTSSGQGRGEPVSGKKQASPLIQFLGVRGLIVAAGAILAVLAFFVLPYYSSYTGYNLATGYYYLLGQELNVKWWLELVLAVAPLFVVIAQKVVPSVKQRRRLWSLVIGGCGVLGALINYWFMNALADSNLWSFGTWGYFVGMALVVVGGLLSIL